jgi:4-hydroxy-tetrahydrodipicolinate synthase
MKAINGTFVALTTPMDEEGKLKLEYLPEKFQRLEAAGLRRYFCLGTNGEFYALTVEEKLCFLEAVRDTAPPGVLLSAGVGAVTTGEAVFLAKKAQDLGYHAIAVISPYFLQLSEDQLFLHYMRIAEASSLPFILYNIPSRTGNHITVNLIRRLRNQTALAGIKDSSGNMETIRSFLALKKEGDFKVLCGTDSLILEALQEGADGAVSGLANLFPRLVQDIYDMYKQGCAEEAAKLQETLTAIRGIFTLGYSPSITKLAENLLGYPVGPSRAPGDLVDPLIRDELVQRLENFRLGLAVNGGSR